MDANTDRILTTLDLAVRDPKPFNRHAKRLLRLSADPSVALVAARLLSGWNASLVQALDHEGHLDEYTVMGVVLRAAADGLPNAEASSFDPALEVAIATAFTLPNADDMKLGMRGHDPHHSSRPPSCSPVSSQPWSSPASKNAAADTRPSWRCGTLARSESRASDHLLVDGVVDDPGDRTSLTVHKCS